MLLTPHILTGVAIISKVQNPILGLFLVFLSHYFLDCFPQKEYSIKNIREKRWSKSLPDFIKVALDIIFGLLIVFLIVGYHPIALIAAFLVITPDGTTLLYHLFPKNRLLEKHWKIHNALNDICQNKKIPVFWGVMSQIAVIIIAIFFLR